MSVELRALIRHTAEQHPSASPREVAEYVAKLTPDENQLDFYIEALQHLVLQLLAHDRRGAFNGPPAPRSGKDNRSPKLDRRRDWWADLLRQRIPTSGDNWKVLAECTVDDLQHCVRERETQIAGFRRQIRNFEWLISLLVKHGARTVADLPPQREWPS